MCLITVHPVFLFSYRSQTHIILEYGLAIPPDVAALAGSWARLITLGKITGQLINKSVRSYILIVKDFLPLISPTEHNPNLIIKLNVDKLIYLIHQSCRVMADTNVRSTFEMAPGSARGLARCGLLYCINYFQHCMQLLFGGKTRCPHHCTHPYSVRSLLALITSEDSFILTFLPSSCTGL